MLQLSAVGGVERLYPYTSQVSAFVSSADRPVGIVGATKYLRQYKSSVVHGAIIVSSTPSSQQAWIVHTEGGTILRHNVMLWNKNVVVL
jgi:hypothetical protein